VLLRKELVWESFLCDGECCVMKRAKLATSILDENEDEDGDGDEAFMNVAIEATAEGSVLAEAGRFDEALSAFSRGLGAHPNDPILHEQSAQVLMELGLHWKAVFAAERATQLKPDWSEGYWTLARARREVGEVPLSLEAFDRAAAMLGSSDQALLEMEREEVRALLPLWLKEQQERKEKGGAAPFNHAT